MSHFICSRGVFGDSQPQGSERPVPCRLYRRADTAARAAGPSAGRSPFHPALQPSRPRPRRPFRTLPNLQHTSMLPLAKLFRATTAPRLVRKLGATASGATVPVSTSAKAAATAQRLSSSSSTSSAANCSPAIKSEGRVPGGPPIGYRSGSAKSQTARPRSPGPSTGSVRRQLKLEASSTLGASRVDGPAEIRLADLDASHHPCKLSQLPRQSRHVPRRPAVHHLVRPSSCCSCLKSPWHAWENVRRPRSLIQSVSSGR
jgi:hypothetical protein